MLNATYFRRATKVALDSVSYNTVFPDNKSVVATLDANLRTLGYTLHSDLAKALLSVPAVDIKAIFSEVIKEAKEIKGVRNYRPMYPNFPKQVMDARAAELWLNAIIHYWSGGTLLPVYEKETRPALDFSEDKYTAIHLGSEDDYTSLMNNLMLSKSGFSETDKADIRTHLSDFKASTFRFLATNENNFSNRENKAFIRGEAYKADILELGPWTGDTATDVLRLAVALSDGDTSLSEKTNFRSFKRKERRALLHILEMVSSGSRVEDMMRYAQTWKRLGERLHPGEFHHEGATSAFAAVRNNLKVETFNSKIEKAIADEDMGKIIYLLSQRPGEFARRLDKVLRMCESSTARALVLVRFQGVAFKVSPTVLLQTRNAFINRDKEQRVFFPKGSVAKMQVKEDVRERVSKADCASVVNIIDGALGTIFGERESLGGVYVDPALKSVAIPFGLRNASKALKTLGRGSRLPLDNETGVLRFFIWWKNAESRKYGYSGHTDIDLSAVCMDDRFERVMDISFYNLRATGAVHSGDITNAPDGASEFIDIDINRLREQGIRYVAMTLHSYSGHNFVELPECFAGFMERTDLGSGEIYDPRTVTNKVDLTAKTKSATPFVFDLETGEAVWVDLTMRVQPAFSTAYNSRGQIKTVVQAMVELTPPNLYDLFTLHGMARGGLVSRNKAAKVYSLDGDVTPFDSEEILANYL